MVWCIQAKPWHFREWLIPRSAPWQPYLLRKPRLAGRVLLSQCCLTIALSFGSGVLQAQEKPDAPSPQPDATARQQQKPSVASEIFKNKPIEIVLGFKPNLAPLE